MAPLIGNYVENRTSPKGIGDLQIAPHARTGIMPSPAGAAISKPTHSHSPHLSCFGPDSTTGMNRFHKVL